jgi:hypothetical protein
MRLVLVCGGSGGGRGGFGEGLLGVAPIGAKLEQERVIGCSANYLSCSKVRVGEP